MAGKRFLRQLQHQARLQSKLQQRSLLPHQLDRLGSWVGNYPWQTLVVLSGLTALILDLLNQVRR